MCSCRNMLQQELTSLLSGLGENIKRVMQLPEAPTLRVLKSVRLAFRMSVDTAASLLPHFAATHRVDPLELRMDSGEPMESRQPVELTERKSLLRAPRDMRRAALDIGRGVAP